MSTKIEAEALISEFAGQPLKLGKAVNVTPLLCRSAVRELFLDVARRERPFNKFSRVSEDTLVALNAQVRAWIVARVKAAPSKGVTL